jgi:hypothetical protein
MEIYGFFPYKFLISSKDFICQVLWDLNSNAIPVGTDSPFTILKNLWNW